MAHYLPPDSVGVSIFNSTQYPSLNDPLTTEAANALYLSKTGGNVFGSLLPIPTLTYDLGSPSQEWGNLYCVGLTASIVANSQRLLSTGDTSAQNEFFPAFSHASEPTGGMYFPLDNTIGISANGTESALFESTQVQSAKWKSNAVVGTQNAVTPALSHTSDTDTGIYFPLSNQLGISANGVASTLFGVNGFGSTVQPFLYIRSSGAQSVGSGVSATVTFATPVQNQGSTITNTSGSITFSQAGVYLFCGKVFFSANGQASGARQIYFTNSTLVSGRQGTQLIEGLTVNGDFALSTSAVMLITTSDTVRLIAVNGSVAAHNIGSGTTGANELQVIRLC
jgi:hypothetical protein